jgi:hypothetical protein
MTWTEFLTSLWTPEVQTAVITIWGAFVTAMLARLGMQSGNKPAPTPAPEEKPAADPLADFPILKAITEAAKKAIPGSLDDILIDTGAKIMDRVRRQRGVTQQGPAAVAGNPPTPAIGKADEMGLR